jgi:NADH-quinone oxidoreductase subunit C
MADESKSSSPPPPGNEPKREAVQPPGSVQSVPPGDKAAPTSTAAKPAGEHGAPPKAAAPATTPWESEMVARLKRQYGSGIDPVSYLGQNYFVVDRSLIPEFLLILRDEEKFDYCVDLTAVHWPEREKPFDVIWILYSFERNERIRVKVMIADGEALPSSTSMWPTTNWLEREVYDMFGITFAGHPDLKRILLPDGWKGHPLRKEYGIIQQDKEWVQINLGIESGQ